MPMLHRIIGVTLWIIACIELPVGLNWYRNARTTLTNKLVSPNGSIHAVCGETSNGIDKFASIDFRTSPATYLHYYFFNIENAKEYLHGSDAQVVEKGPYALRKFSTKFDISFGQSTITTVTDVKSAVTYDVANSYIPLDKETSIVSSMKRADDLTLSWSEAVDIESEPSRMPAHLSMSDQIVNLSPTYLNFLGNVANDEINMALRLVCTPQQIANIALAGTGANDKAQCTTSELNDPAKTNCACCMHDHKHTLATHENSGAPIAFSNCNVWLDDTSDTMKKITLLAKYDGGVEVNDIGDDELRTPLIQSHSVNDWMFGHPSAFLGMMGSVLQLPEAMSASAANGLTRAEVAAKVMKGMMDNDLTMEVGNVAEYTKSVGAVCSSKCTEPASTDALADSPLGWMCSGTATPRHQTSVKSEISLGGIDCKPYSSTFVTKMYCKAVQSTLLVAPSSPGYEACKCADGSSDWSTTGCCLAGGSHAGDDLTGRGCLYPVAGLVDTNYAGKNDKSETIDVGKAVETWMEKKPKDNKATSFMCPVAAAARNLYDGSEHGKFNYYENIGTDAVKSIVTYHSTGNPRMQQGDKTDANAVPYTSNVTGIDGEMIAGTGLTSFPSDIKISDDLTLKTVPIFNHIAKLPFDFFRNRTLYAKSCGTDDACISAARFSLLKRNFHHIGNGTAANGKGLPYAGLQPIGHLMGVPSYIHQPFYMDGDAELYTQQKNTHVDHSSGDGNGINMYHMGAYADYANAADPGSFNVLNSDNIKVDEAFVASNNVTFESYIDVEPATGRTLNMKMGLGMSFSIWECSPTNNANCAHGLKARANEGMCYNTAGTDLFNSFDDATKTKYEQISMKDFSYPCSAANLITPKVVGGKIMPMYWSDTIQNLRKDDVDVLTGFTFDNANNHRTWLYLFGAFFYLLNIGFILILCVTPEGKIRPF